VIFAAPAWLLALLLLPLAAAARVWLGSRDRQRLGRLVARPLWPRVVRLSGERWRWLRLALLLAGAAGVIVALARPQWGMVREKVEREGADVVLLLDTSASMATADVAPSRFFLARQALLQLISRLEGDRFALVAFEGEAYPLVPLTLDADALALFLDTAEPGLVPAPGTSLGVGLAKGLDSFVDKERRNKVMVLVSDGEDLEGEVDAAVRRAKEAGVVVHTVGVGTEAGQPVPETDASGRVTGYKRDERGDPVVSRLNTRTLEAIAQGTGGQMFRLTPQDTSLSRLAAAIEGMEQKALAQEYTYRRKEHFQAPLAAGLLCLVAGLLLPLPRLRRTAAAARAAVLCLLWLSPLRADAQVAKTPAAPPGQRPAASAPAAPASAAPHASSLVDELLLRPRRATAEGRAQYERGNHPQALAAFERAAATRPRDLAARFNVADGLYKNGRYDEAGALYRALGADAGSPVAEPSRFNLGNSLYQKQDFRGAVKAYRDALRVSPGAEDARRNLELALRALREQEQQKKQQEQQRDQDKKEQGQDKKEQEKQDSTQQPPQNRDQKQQEQKGKDQQKQPAPQRSPQPGQDQQQPRTPQEQADQRFRQEAGMPRERAMQLLDALQQNEKAEQKKLLALKRAQRRKGKDW
jgi:Ca-activated chloride channel family protein